MRKETKKIIAGLDNSGKTSILLTLQGNSNLMSYFKMTPTKDINISELMDEDEGDLIIWELGGQEQYRSSHQRKFQRIFDNTQELIFVIDIQDEARYELALEYLKEIIETLKEFLDKIKISVFFHKFDPELVAQGDTLRNKLDARLVEPLKSIIPLKYSFNIYSTSIFTSFKKSIYSIML